MKKIINKIAILALAFWVTTSCEDYLEGTNINPNDPVEVSSAALLAPAQATLSYTYNANFSRWSSFMVQQTEGVARQQAGFNNYNFVGSNFEADWFDLYVEIIQNLNIMIEQSGANGHNHYVGVGNVMKAFSLLLMTDYWNSIPYSDGFKGVEVLQPTFDSQADIFVEVHTLLASARQSLSSGDGGLALSGDLIYGGNISSWIKASHAIDARAYLHQGLLSNSNYQSALASINSAFDSSADDLAFQFGDGATTAAPWFQFNRDRGDIGFNSTYNDSLAAVSDPRLDIYDGADGLNSIWGENFDSHAFFVINRKSPLITYTELMFAKAECLLQTGGSQAEIREAFLEGIRSSFSSLGLDAEYAAYVAQVEVAPATITLNEIITQKWFALYTDPESFSDWRRTGIPSLTPNDGVAIPTRWLYPQSEIELNLNTPDVTLTDKVDWDVN